MIIWQMIFVILLLIFINCELMIVISLSNEAEHLHNDGDAAVPANGSDDWQELNDGSTIVSAVHSSGLWSSG
jgi:hypothetical protein